MDLNEMPVIERRRIEALVLGPVIRAFQEEFGEEQTNELVRKVMVGIATEQGRELAERVKGENLQEFADGKGAWRKNGALETNEIEKNPDRYEFDVTRCRYAEMYHEIGYGDLGGILSCARDFAFSEGFNPKINLRRGQTIMGGDGFCDFRYELPVEQTSK